MKKSDKIIAGIITGILANTLVVFCAIGIHNFVDFGRDQVNWGVSFGVVYALSGAIWYQCKLLQLCNKK